MKSFFAVMFLVTCNEALADPFPPTPQKFAFHSDDPQPQSGWQKPLPVTYHGAVGHGFPSVQVSYSCPQQFPVVVSGAYNTNAGPQSKPLEVAFNGPDLETSTPTYSAWQWNINWQGERMHQFTAYFDIYCVAATKQN
jgi:hypothetical protein